MNPLYQYLNFIEQIRRSMYNSEMQALEDPAIVPMKWQEDEFQRNGKKSLKIGYFYGDGFYQPHPGCQRAVNEAVDFLRSKGHEVVEFHSPPGNEIIKLFLGFLFTDYLSGIKDLLDKSVIVDACMNAIVPTIYILKLPDFVRKYIVNPMIRTFINRDALPAPIASGSDLMAAVDKREKILENYMKEMEDQGLDLLITAASLTPAPIKVT